MADFASEAGFRRGHRPASTAMAASGRIDTARCPVDGEGAFLLAEERGAALSSRL
jgi:hypothetical protein